MSTLMRKRALARANGSNKRARTGNVVILRGPKPEMKSFIYNLSHSAVTGSDHSINQIASGSANAQRVGSKVKIHNIEYLLTSGSSFRVDILVPNDAGTRTTASFVNAVNRDAFSVIKTFVVNSTTTLTTGGRYGNIKLPLGMISKYTGTGGSTINKGEIYVRVTSQAAVNVDGYFRVWYTDV